MASNYNHYSKSYNVPVPDYDYATVRQKNPYIPVPDYTTFKYNKTKNRPSLNNIGTEFQIDEEKPNLIETEIVKPIENYRRIPVTKRSIPRLPDVNSNFQEIKTHSYIEDRETDEETHHRSTKEHIKHIGVPVLPGIAEIHAPTFESVAPVSSDQNKAFLRHLENHKKFDTVRGNFGIDDCEICQIMRKQLETEQSSHSWNEQSPAMIQAQQPQQHNSYPANRRARTDIRSVFQQIDEQPEPEPEFFNPISARARYNYDMKREGEISINAMESVEILHMEKGFALCRRADKAVGWIPTSVFEH